MDRWEEVQSLFHAAGELRPSERGAYLSEACGADDELRTEVESLLAFAGKADELLETPVLQNQESHPAVASGTRLGPYEVGQLVGYGGTGDVYEAEDLRLKRRVAIKVLREARQASPAERRRFLEEARAVSALNHPNIVRIYELESEGEVDFIVMELLTGETLAGVIGAGRLSVDRTLEFARQIAHALKAAHAIGIVHRDIKPGNIVITDDGTLKVLDFGLAKRIHAADGTDGGEAGVVESHTSWVFGTASYMSPEQASGGPVDARSDIFSTGAVMYEMLRGAPAFAGAPTAAILKAVLQYRRRP